MKRTVTFSENMYAFALKVIENQLRKVKNNLEWYDNEVKSPSVKRIRLAGETDEDRIDKFNREHAKARQLVKNHETLLNELKQGEV